MGRAIVVMVSTLLFAIFGLVVAWLSVSAAIKTNLGSSRMTETIILTYSVAPLFGAAAGFTLSAIALIVFTPRQKGG